MADDRLKTAASLIRCGQSLVMALDDGPDRWQEYWDQRNAGGDFTDQELAALGITNAQLIQAVTLVEAFNKFMAGTQPANDVYRVVVNGLRHVGAQI